MSSQFFARCGLAAAVVLFAGCMAIVLAGAPIRRGPVAVAGAAASAFVLPDADEQLVSLEQLRGKVVLLCMTDAHRCGSEQLSRFAEIQQQYSSEPRVAPVTVVKTDVEPGTVRARDLVQNLAAAGLTGTRVIDVSSEVWRNYRVDSSAALFVIDRNGTIRHRSGLSGDRATEVARARSVIDQLLPNDAVASAKK
jgi:cytochrome oxidase Cu insertion factor (SCO1/SenC/PrrC family)